VLRHQILRIFVAHLSLVIYEVSSFGPMWELDLSQGWFGLLGMSRPLLKLFWRRCPP